ncbi:MAG: hypothetical protein JXL80_14030 [Planctomycetes bacterium]|nr:hypothetical protein [Planctomycetota bacterium]
MNRRFAHHLLIAVAAVALLGGTVLADSLRNRAGINYAGRIRGLSADGIVIDAGGEKTFAFSEISKLTVDEAPDLAKAEDLLASGESAEAAKLYAKVRDKAGSGWLKHYVDARLVRAYDESRQFYRASKALISLCALQSPLVSQVKLPTAQGKGGADNQSALKEIEQALATVPAGPFADRLKTLRINIMLVEGDPADVLGVVEQQLKSPDETARKQARAKHIELLLDLNQLEKAGRSLEQGRKELNKPEDQPYLYYLDGRYLFATAEARRKAAEGKDNQPVDERDYLRAALSFMRLPIHFSLMQKDLAAESLVWAARAMQRANVPPQEAYTTLEEAVRKFPNTQGAEMAQKMLQEMGGGS